MKDLGNINHLTIKITKPMKMDFENKEMGDIMFLVGANATGKSLVLKLTWAIHFCISLYAVRKTKYKELTEAFRLVFDNTITNNNLDGKVAIQFDGAYTEINLEDGKVLHNWTIDLPEDVVVPTPVFMSKDMRTFDEFKRYLMLRKKIGVSGHRDGILKYKELLEFYRIYDVVYCEMFIERVGKSKAIPVFLRKKFKDILEKDVVINTVGVDLKECNIFHTDQKGDKVNMTSYSAGEQSLMNMFLTQAILL